ncbi:MAG: hypothetical protein RI909_1293 [Bacteroidota bacterium]|jgi:hypothetical protein
MLDTFCGSLSDEAQLRISLTLGKLALPVWEDYFTKNPAAIDQVNALISEANRVNGGLEKIDIGFPKRAIEKIERSLAAAKEKSADHPVPIMKSDATLSPMLATCMQPLQNPIWDSTLNQSVRLVFTLVFNMLVWILHRRKTEFNETHIYVSINQGADVLLREDIRSQRSINTILNEYEQQKRQDTEDSDWENALPVGRSEGLNQEDIYRKFIGEKITKGQVDNPVAKEALRQMREEGKSYWNLMDEYMTGTSTTYSYDKEIKSFKRHEMDAIVGSFSNHIPMTESEMLSFISQQSLVNLREAGFEV